MKQLAKPPQIILPPSVEGVIALFNEKNWQAYAVGGCIRDYLLGLPVNDWDLCTDATPEQMQEAFSHLFLPSPGARFGTVLLKNEGQVLEVTTFRIDLDYTDHRRPDKVMFSKTLDEDLRRRDFTINALAYSPDQGLVDVTGGLIDLENRLLRTVGQARDRFAEDALRILRLFRFAATLGFSIEPETLSGAKAQKSSLLNLAPERLQREMARLLAAPFAGQALGFMAKTDVLSLFFPGEQEEIDLAIRAILLSPPDVAIRLAILLQNLSPTKASLFLKKQKWSKQMAKTVEQLLLFSHQPLTSPVDLKKALYELGKDQVDRLLTLLALMSQVGTGDKAAAEQGRTLLMKILKNGDCVDLSTLAVTGKTLIDHGFPKGPQIGEVLMDLLIDVWAHPEHNNQSFLLAKAWEIKAKQTNKT